MKCNVKHTTLTATKQKKLADPLYLNVPLFLIYGMKQGEQQMNKVMLTTPDSYISKHVIKPLRKSGAFGVEYRAVIMGDTIHHIVNFLGNAKALDIDGNWNYKVVMSPSPMIIPTTIYIRGDA